MEGAGVRFGNDPGTRLADQWSRAGQNRHSQNHLKRANLPLNGTAPATSKMYSRTSEESYEKANSRGPNP